MSEGLASMRRRRENAGPKEASGSRLRPPPPSTLASTSHPVATPPSAPYLALRSHSSYGVGSPEATGPTSQPAPIRRHQRAWGPPLARRRRLGLSPPICATRRSLGINDFFPSPKISWATLVFRYQKQKKKKIKGAFLSVGDAIL